jgi:hypothetical protein
MDKQHLLKILAIVAIVATVTALTTYAIILYYGQTITTVPVEQAVWIDGKRFNETITETLNRTYGGCTVYANHTLENKGDTEAKVKFVLLNVTDSKGNLVTDGTVTVSWLVKNEPVVTYYTIPAHTTVDFSIAISFNYAIMPDTYTINTQVQPYMS